ncbi:hypothetical protein BBO99_00006232 [Phytophthora kernoviae]|uniref:DUSP domain-containing protein n=2 Tax=Phytophthora kernoviae TaxID=325452 RepID=A0A3R7JSE3_9STRA|nr:hypothetical protein G195_007417 [Phytophthora kernoviae 00238/432]KAG2520223.1 hypothetical protein JM16_006858 [Phytophthora kernoviae]KAG2522053.1 hypothetical protein JM18_006295 [Phytophthora kernoviae]RLN06870.1 hypothetical protein BBI17_006812 [Phytophthora kernoviae]RLN78065.1 hypothetical protein BBO99_00006232 [Phytophthora kernoviae]
MNSPGARRSRMERTGSSDQQTPSLFRRLQGKKSASKTSTECLETPQPPPRHSHRRILSRDRKRPTVIFYSNSSDSDPSLLKRGDSAVTDGELSEDDGGHSEDRFDMDNKMPDFAASVGPRDTLSRSRGPSGGLMRMSVTWGRASERLEATGDARRDSRRAARQSANWLAFTSSASSSNHSMDYGFDAETTAKSPTAKDDELASMGRAPGPIDNLSLLVLSRGKLVQRPGLVRDDAIADDAAASSGEDADFQLLSPEVWEVFQRLYGGSPAIHVNLVGTDPTAWVVDVASLLATAKNSNRTRVQVTAAVERALTTRHQDEDDVASIRGPRSGSNQARTPTFAMSSSSDMGASNTPMGSRSRTSYFKQQPKSPAWTASTSSSSSSLSEDKERARSPAGSGRMQLEDLETDVASLSMAKDDTVGEDDMRATTSVRSPTAALAASAFAVAMKQARLNAQKAINDRSSRVITA